MTSTWGQAYRRLLAKKARLQRLHQDARDTAARVTAERDEARADAQLWRNLAWLGAYSGRHGIRGDRLQPRPRIPWQRSAESAREAR